ncbi:MAG TPA: hypothetical protein PLY70_08445 [Saprospiraceae bacterium]|nr:hypothetical protein [Saprospiraceae bacterium]HPN70304.1 hypothetical protein [Saprospiraceae bacterium]
MRVIGEIDKAGYKITVFKHEEKISIKLEKDLLEQTYKFRSGSLVDGLESAKQFVDILLAKEVDESFRSMNKKRNETLEEMVQQKPEDFPNII